MRDLSATDRDLLRTVALLEAFDENVLHAGTHRLVSVEKLVTRHTAAGFGEATPVHGGGHRRRR